jgi:hypothetical protein
MLQNCAAGLLHQGRDREALDVLRRVAVHHAPREELDARLTLWCAIAASLDGEWPVADRLLQRTPVDAVAERNRSLRDFAAVLLSVLRDPPGPTCLTGERLAVIARADNPAALETASLRLVRLGIWRMARHARRMWMAVRAWGSLH